MTTFYIPYNSGEVVDTPRTAFPVAETQSLHDINHYQSSLTSSGSSIVMMGQQTNQFYTQPNEDFLSVSTPMRGLYFGVATDTSRNFNPNFSNQGQHTVGSTGVMAQQMGQYFTQPNADLNAWNNIQHVNQHATGPGLGTIYQLAPTGEQIHILCPVNGPMPPPPSPENQQGVGEAQQKVPTEFQQPETYFSVTERPTFVVRNPNGEMILYPGFRAATVTSPEYSGPLVNPSMDFGSHPFSHIQHPHPQEEYFGDGQRDVEYIPDEAVEQMEEVTITQAERDEHMERQPASSSRKKEKTHCVFCRRMKEPREIYESHVIRNNEGLVTCPALRQKQCSRCLATGDYAHTPKYCPSWATATNIKDAEKCSSLFVGNDSLTNVE